MPDDHETSIPQSALDAAGDWFARRQGRRDAKTDGDFERWLFEDPVHRAAYRQVADQWDQSGLAALSEIGRTRQLGRAPFYQRERPRAAAFAIALILVLSAGLFAAQRAGMGFSLSSPAEAAVYTTTTGEIRTIRLLDGSTITLDTRSRVEARYSASERRLVLPFGRARFSVVADASRPFVVVVPDGEIVARGTVFDVEARSVPTRATILHGTVEMRSSRGLTARGWLLAQGSQAPLSADPSSGPIPAGEARWVEGMIALNEAPLPVAVEQINRYNQRQIRLAGPSLGKLAISGAFRARDPIAFAQMIAKLAPVRIEQLAGGSIVISSPKAPTQ